MEEVKCPNCGKKLAEINKEELSITFEKGVEAIKPTVSCGIYAAAFKCPNCERTHIKGVAI